MHRTKCSCIIIGLCLVLNFGCGGNGPTFPDNWGLQVENPPSTLIANQQMTLKWVSTDQLLNEFTVFYSVDAVSWIKIGTTSSHSLGWKVPGGVDAPSAKIKVEGYNINLSNDVLATAFTADFSLRKFGRIDNFTVDVPDAITNGVMSTMTVTAKDRYNNVVADFHDPVSEIIYGCASNFAPNHTEPPFTGMLMRTEGHGNGILWKNYQLDWSEGMATFSPTIYGSGFPPDTHGTSPGSASVLLFQGTDNEDAIGSDNFTLIF